MAWDWILLQKGSSFCFGKCAFSIALSIGLVMSSPTLSWSANASQSGPVLPDLSVLISGPPIKDPGALLRYALPIDNKAIREVQKPLEDITESLKIAGVKALDSVERMFANSDSYRPMPFNVSLHVPLIMLDLLALWLGLTARLVDSSNESVAFAVPAGNSGSHFPILKYMDQFNVRQASRALKQGESMIVSSVAKSKKEHGKEILNKLALGMEELQQIVEGRDRDAVAPKQKELLQYVGDEISVEEDMVDGFPYEVPEEYSSMPLLKGRAAVDMKVKIKDNPNMENCVFHIVLDGYNAPVTAGNFIDLVERHFYDGMEIQRADGFVVQTGDPEGPAEGFIDPSTEKIRSIPLEIMVVGDKTPVYGATLEELGAYKAQTKLPFNAFGTMAMARDEFEDNSASSQVFWLLKESELTPSNANILDGRYAVFGYVTENEDFLADVKVGDVIESIQVVSGLENLVNPSYKIAG
ncbi:cytochrome P450 monooxygenase 38 [Asimina triloba]